MACDFEPKNSARPRLAVTETETSLRPCIQPHGMSLWTQEQCKTKTCRDWDRDISETLHTTSSQRPTCSSQVDRAGVYHHRRWTASHQGTCYNSCSGNSYDDKTCQVLVPPTHRHTDKQTNRQTDIHTDVIIINNITSDTLPVHTVTAARVYSILQHSLWHVYHTLVCKLLILLRLWCYISHVLTCLLTQQQCN